MKALEEALDRVLSCGEISRDEALVLYRDAPLEELTRAADAIRRARCGTTFDLCAIINGKSGRCSENCRFCAQSAHNGAKIDEYELLSADEIVAGAKRAEAAGVLRFSIVTSGKRLSSREVDQLCEAIRRIRAETSLAVCCSSGLLSVESFRALKAAGMTRAHNNLETSRRFFPSICTTHSYDEKLAALRAAREAGLSLCSGGIFGLGETAEDRIDMALTLRDVGVESVPINILNAIPGTPLAETAPLTSTDARRIVAIYRFLLPTASIRLAGGRGLLDDFGFRCFESGANATITGAMLTTGGVDAKSDLQMIRILGYRPGLDGREGESAR